MMIECVCEETKRVGTTLTTQPHLGQQQFLTGQHAEIMASLTIICVLGGPVDEKGIPKAHLALRLDQALAEGGKLEAMGAAHKYLLTGGAVKTYGSAGFVTEASAMARYLTEHGGVAASECLLEEEAVCTLTNAIHAKRLLDRGALWSETTALLLVTSSCHMARSATCFCTVFPPAQIRMAPAPDPVRKMMNFVLKTRSFVSKTRNCVSKTRNFVFK